MNNKKYTVRLLGTILSGFLLLYLTHQSQYSSAIFDFLYITVASLLILSFLVWSFITDFSLYLKTKRLYSLLPIGTALVITSIVWIWHTHIQAIFNQPTLLKIFDGGDFGGTIIDFKTDGTCIINKSSIFDEEYKYGNYEIRNDTIKLQLDKEPTQLLLFKIEAIPKKSQYDQLHPISIENEAIPLEYNTTFFLTIDNR
jgi:hypothetical protein